MQRNFDSQSRAARGCRMPASPQPTSRPRTDASSLFELQRTWIPQRSHYTLPDLRDCAAPRVWSSVFRLPVRVGTFQAPMCGNSLNSMRASGLEFSLQPARLGPLGGHKVHKMVKFRPRGMVDKREMEQAQLFETADARGCSAPLTGVNRRASAVPYPRRYEVCSLRLAMLPEKRLFEEKCGAAFDAFAKHLQQNLAAPGT